LSARDDYVVFGIEGFGEQRWGKIVEFYDVGRGESAVVVRRKIDGGEKV